MTPWTAARQASLSFTISQSLLRLMSIECMIPSNLLIRCCPLFLLPSVFPSIRVFSSEVLFASSGQTILASAFASVLPVNIQGLFPLGLTGLISVLSRVLSRVFSNTTIQKYPFFAAKPSFMVQHSQLYMTVGKNHSFVYTDLCQQTDVSAF